jgi:hypothetical protein
MSEIKDQLTTSEGKAAENFSSNLVYKVANLRPHPDVVAQRLGEEVALVNLQTNRIFELNRTGACLWDLLCKGCDRSEINYASDC